MGAKVTVLGVRHHGPGSARLVLRALQDLKPDLVLIEGPSDGNSAIAFANSAELKPPVALLVFNPQTPSESLIYPFAVFSPEWQAIRWSLESSIPARFIDWPLNTRPAPLAENEPKESDAPKQEASQPAPAQQDHPHHFAGLDPLDALARAAGLEDGEAWWSRMIEERRGVEHPLAVFDAITQAMRALRDARDTDRSTQALSLASKHDDLDTHEAVREAHMRREIRKALKEGSTNIAVICGAWHAPVLEASALKEISASADDATLAQFKPRKGITSECTWIPWTYDRLAAASGYGAGITSPGWYEHIWEHPSRPASPWMTKTGRLLREEGLDASPASVIESVRMAETLATIRGRVAVSLDDLEESTQAVLCHGQSLPMKLIESKLIIGERLGQVPDGVPMVPLQRDLLKLQKALRMKVSAVASTLDLDQRKPQDLERSHLLHRLSLLNVPWGIREEKQSRSISTFHEIWRLEWKPEFAVSLLESARYGNTVVEAASAYTCHQAGTITTLDRLTQLVDDVLLADLPESTHVVLQRIANLAAVSTDVLQLMQAIVPLARVLRYGNVRRTDLDIVEPVVQGMLSRICIGLPAAATGVNDDSAGQIAHLLRDVHEVLATLENRSFMQQWLIALESASDRAIHGLIAGRAWRLVFDADPAREEAAVNRLGLALSRGGDAQNASRWMEGFLAESGAVLLHDQRLLTVLDQWVCNLSREEFESVSPIGRRTFATFERAERRNIGQKLAGMNTMNPATASTRSRSLGAHQATDSYNPARGELVEPLIKLLLGASR